MYKEKYKLNVSSAGVVNVWTKPIKIFEKMIDYFNIKKTTKEWVMQK